MIKDVPNELHVQGVLFIVPLYLPLLLLLKAVITNSPVLRLQRSGAARHLKAIVKERGACAVGQRML
jgi:hypothetical protein